MADVVSVAAKYDAFAAEVQGIGVVVPTIPVLAIGARCKATTKPLVAVRSVADANAASIGTQPNGSQGVVVAPGLQNGGWWVNFDTGVDGWVWAANLVAI